MKTWMLILHGLLVGSSAFAGSQTHKCVGEVENHQSKARQRIQMVMDTQSMTIALFEQNGRESLYQVISSRNSKSYRKGIQYIDAQLVSGNFVSHIRVEMPWTSYYGPEVPRLLLLEGSDSTASGALLCDNSLYTGPSRYENE